MKRTCLLQALLPAALLAALLTGCSNESPASDFECAPEGDVAKALKFEGEFGTPALTLTSKTPLKATTLERAVLIQGDGDALKQGDVVTAQLTIFQADDGSTFTTEAAQLQLDETQLMPWVLDMVGCSRVGDRVAAVAPVTEVLVEGEAANYGLEEDGHLVIVFDITGFGVAEPGSLEAEELLEKAEGVAQSIPEGLPNVELASDGSPTITMPETPAPTELTVTTLIEGAGEVVQPGDRVYVHYRGVIWRTGEEFDSSWSRGAPADFLTTGVIGGFSEALVGQKVGSQVMSVVPAEDGGYGGDWLVQQGYEQDDVMVFVLDILGTVHAG